MMNRIIVNILMKRMKMMKLTIWIIKNVKKLMKCINWSNHCIFSAFIENIFLKENN